MPRTKGKARKGKSSITTARSDSERERSPTPPPPAPAAAPAAAPADAPAAAPAASSSARPPSRAMSSSTEEGPEEQRQVPRRRQEKLHLPLEDEQKIADWFSEKPIFFDKSRRDYKDAAVKLRLLEDLAKTLSVPCTAHSLKTWLDSMRTAAGKLLKQGPSGTAKRNPTEKEQWIIKNFGFLEDHIKRIRGRQGAAIKKSQRPSQDDGSSSATQQDSGPEEEEECEESIVEVEDFIEEPVPGKSKGKSIKRKRGSSPSPMVQQLMNTAVKTGQALDKRLMREQEEETKDPHITRVKNWCQYLFTEAIELEKHDYEDFQLQVVNLLHQVKRGARQRQQQPHQFMVPHPQPLYPHHQHYPHQPQHYPPQQQYSAFHEPRGTTMTNLLQMTPEKQWTTLEPAPPAAYQRTQPASSSAVGPGPSAGMQSAVPVSSSDLDSGPPSVSSLFSLEPSSASTPFNLSSYLSPAGTPAPVQADVPQSQQSQQSQQ